jgi:ATP-dependent helicase/nuclease subunit B
MAAITDVWPVLLDDAAALDLTERRNRVLDRLAERWRHEAPSGFTVAAGISTPAPAIAALLRVVARMNGGQVVFAGIDHAMPVPQWEALSGLEKGGRTQRLETHPQFHLWLLLDRMGFARDDVQKWPIPESTSSRKRATRMAKVAGAMAPAAFTGDWAAEIVRGEKIEGVSALELSTPAQEALAIALALREALEDKGKTAALVTPDRLLAHRVSTQLKRWGIDADDSAGRPLSHTPQGTLLLSIADAIAEDFAPVPLLALLKHPLVHGEGPRQSWLDGARSLDLALRGPSPPPGLAGISSAVDTKQEHGAELRERARAWWEQTLPLLQSLDANADTLAAQIAQMREAAGAIATDRAWAGEAGRAAADLIAALETLAEQHPVKVSAVAFPILLRTMMDDIPIRPPQGGHPRIFIWGLLEAKLQSADFMVLSGLNEGVWPQLQNADPWLAPAVRGALGLPSLERRIGLAAHDLVSAMAAPRVLLTRSKRDDRSPTSPSRFWLRLQTYSGGLPKPDTRYDLIARALDNSPENRLAPVWPAPPVEDRPTKLNVTDVDRLKADPFSFYAKSMLGLSALEPPGGEPDAKWRGTFLHDILDKWQRDDDCAPDALVARVRKAFNDAPVHPVVKRLWQPRFEQAAGLFEGLVAQDRATGRSPLASEVKGSATRAGITLTGKADRIDRLVDGTLAILDYKTGAPPGNKQILAGYALQLGLLGWLAEQGAFDDVNGAATAFEYWSQARTQNGDQTFGYRSIPTGTRKDKISADQMVAHTLSHFDDAAARWLTGDAPFTGKERPEFTFGEFDHLMRYDEWIGRYG